WIRLCIQYHDKECIGDRNPQEIKGLKLIDCGTRKVIRGGVGMKWVALSYVWSLATPRARSSPKRAPCELQQGEVHLPECLPGVISDAMEATVALGYQYLWADQFCIDQSDKDEVADQVGKMDKIYRGAVLTIVSVSSRNGLPGGAALPRKPSQCVTVGKTNFFVAKMDPVSDIEKSTWQTRGWCYQEEMLSRRRLYFTEEGVLFKCHNTTCYE
ncbi:heterokaryon incompatibility protein-domain-containing protein, partial [Apiosordaria backusii]